MNRINELKTRMIKADNSIAGKATKRVAARELRKIASQLYSFANLNPTTKVAEIVRAEADSLHNFVTLQLCD